VLMPDVATEEATAAAEQLRRAIGAQPFATNDTPMKITISIGVADIATRHSASMLRIVPLLCQARRSEPGPRRLTGKRPLGCSHQVEAADRQRSGVTAAS
jgi:hypothetical protein